MKFLSKILFGFFVFSLSVSFGDTPIFAAGERLEVHIHKNSLDGDEWTSTTYPIQVTITAQGTPVGVGHVVTDSQGNEILDANQNGVPDYEEGPLTVLAGDTQTCEFTWDNAGVPQTRRFTLNKYSPRPAGEFILPPLRIPEERLWLSGSLNNCGGGAAEYTQFIQQYAKFPLNIFRTYREHISLPLTEQVMSAGSVTVSISADPSNPNLSPEEINPAADNILGYACKVPQKDASGNIIVDSNNTPIIKEGICEQTISLTPELAKNGVYRVDLVVVAKETEPIIRSTITDPLVQGDNAEFSEWVTFVGNFAIRATTLLDWALAIDETGFNNEKITVIYNKSLNIVNGFFILTLLLIALLWNFSILISKDHLKKLVILFIIGIVTVNFALPVTRLLVDGTNILQRTLLVKENTTFSNTSLDYYDGRLENPNLTAEEQASIAAEQDALRQQLQKNSGRISASDILSAYDLDYSGFVGLQKTSYLDKNYPQNAGDTVATSQLTEKSDLYVDRFKERTVFNLILIFIGAIGQFLIALILLFRYVILWFLLIFSPFLLVLAIFHATRFLFRYWVWLFGRWLLIGPILAMTLFIIVNIWTLTGVPLESSYAAPSGLIFPNTTNLYVSAPGVTSGYLSTPREVMKYIAALMMLYMAVILPFWLTRYIPSAPSNAQKPIFKKSALAISPSPETPPSLQPILPQSQGGNEVIFSQPDVGISFPSPPLSENISQSEKINTSEKTRNLTQQNKERSSEFQKMTTKDLVSTLNIINASLSSRQESSLKQTRLEKQKEHLIQEIQSRAEKNDIIAQNIIQKQDTPPQEKMQQPVRTSRKEHVHQTANTVTSELTQNQQEQHSNVPVSSPSVTTKAYTEIDKAALAKETELKKEVEKNREQKGLQQEKDRLTSKSTLAEEVQEEIRQENMQKLPQETGEYTPNPPSSLEEDIPSSTSSTSQETYIESAFSATPSVETTAGKRINSGGVAHIGISSVQHTPDDDEDEDIEIDLPLRRTSENTQYLRTFDEEEEQEKKQELEEEKNAEEIDWENLQIENDDEQQK